jgi:hypothetical protein
MISKKTFLNSLRTLMVAGSITGFLSGWVFLAHSGKPVSSNASQAGAVQVNLQPLDLRSLAPSNSQLGALQQLPSLPSLSQTLPRFRTRGS